MVTYTVSIAMDHATAEAIRTVKTEYKLSWGELMAALLWIYNNRRDVFEEAVRATKRPSKEDLLLKLAEEYLSKGLPLTKARVREWLKEKGLSPNWAYQLLAIMSALQKVQMPNGVEKKVKKARRRNAGTSSIDEAASVVNKAEEEVSLAEARDNT